MRPSHLRLGLILAALPLCSGCWLLQALGFPVGEEVPYNPKETPGEISVRRDIQFADIPVPIGFELDREVSYSFQGSSFRFGKFRYVGVLGFARTIEFYDQQMRVMGWEPVEETSDGEWSRTLVFRKGREFVRATISTHPDGVEVLLRLLNAPRGTGDEVPQ